MSGLQRRDHHPELGFLELPFPSGEPPLAAPDNDADGAAHTFFAWSKAHLFAAMLETAFPDPPPGVLWGFDALERERFVGEWPDGAYEAVASIAIGILFDPADDAGRRFADHVRAQAPRVWSR